MRVALRPPELEDVDAIWQAMQDRDTAGWLSSIPDPYYRSDALSFVARIATDEDHAITVDGVFAGMIRASEDLGYWLLRDYRGRGVLHRAAQIALLKKFASGADFIHADHMDGNLPSRRALLNLGFRDTGPCSITRLHDGRSLPGRRLVLSRNAFINALTIRTGRCVLSPMTEADFPALHRIATAPEASRMLMRFFPGQSLSEFSALMTPAMNPLRRPLRLAIRQNGNCIGSVGIDKGEAPSIFYFLASEAVGQGIASEIVPVFCDTVQDWYGLDRLAAQAFTDNPASKRVLEKSGFLVTGTDLMLSAGRRSPGEGWIMQRG
ncbi:GNAT family N-acetyltransferase [Paracoccus aerodenitrificans]|uniref:GNAT family N-acetyltransferase n=1 Tax=Paracoccus aerodenitrificans TaxID=3017781 RepID=UPI0022F09DFC|nr:GNAT family N-acetyltransferase [Paracoccus aerodenitrificans]WBU65545.1 GNAT family N-acetyltransferase [Paracoccus aerodenitrificans]